MKQRQSFGGGMGLLILVMLLIMLFSTRNQSMFMPGKISYPEFMMNVENGSISSAVIKPNRETPTGEVELYMTSGDKQDFYVLDTKEIETALRDAGIAYKVAEVQQDNYFMTVILPIALSAGVLIFFFVFMNSRSGGGANAKMMNFGKSRAKMCRPSQTPHLTMSSARIGPRASLGSKKRGNAPPPIHGISKITLKVVVFHFRRFRLPLILHLSSHFTKSD